MQQRRYFLFFFKSLGSVLIFTSFLYETGWSRVTSYVFVFFHTFWIVSFAGTSADNDYVEPVQATEEILIDFVPSDLDLDAIAFYYTGFFS